MNKSVNIDIAICCNKKYDLLKSDCLIPIQSGKAMAKENLGIRGDDTGDNISESNKYYGEGSALYWLWKNSKAQIVGLMQYRRYLNLKNDVDIDIRREIIKNKDKSYEVAKEYGLYSDNIIKLLEEYDILARHKEYTYSFFYGNVEEQFKASHTSWVWDEALNIIKNKNKEFYNFILNAEKKDEMIFKNMFIAKKEVFNNICENTLGITEILKKQIDVDLPEFNNNCRTTSRFLGFILERLTGLYILFLESKGKKVCECGTIDILEAGEHSTEQDEVKSNNLQKITDDKIKPLKSQNVIVMGSSDYYCAPCSVAVESLLENSHISEDGFEFVFLLNSISNENLLLLKSTIKNRISARFYDISEYLKSNERIFRKLDKGSLINHASNESYLRLYIPHLFKEYKKVLWLDCDLIVRHDINELFNLDLGKNWIAAVQDPYIVTAAYSYRGSPEVENIRHHLSKDLKINDFSAYFNAGVLLFNIEQCIADDVEFRIKKITESSLISQYLDPDVLNYLCGGKHVKWLSMYWNVAGNNTFDWNRFKYFPKYKQTSFVQSNAYIFHYSGWCKPWNKPDMVNSYLFWHYARNTPFFEKLVFESQRCSKSTGLNISTPPETIYLYKNYLRAKIRKYHLLNNLTFRLVHKFKSRENKFTKILKSIK